MKKVGRDPAEPAKLSAADKRLDEIKPAGRDVSMPPPPTDLASTKAETLQPARELGPAKPIGPVEVIAWSITSIGIIASLGWNYLNQRNQKNFQTKTRSDQIKLEEFRRIRTPIDAAVAELRVQKDTLRAISASAKQTGDIRREVVAVQKALTEKYLNLEQALGDADRSRFAQGEDWLTPVEAVWDRAVTALAPATSRNSTRAHIISSLTQTTTELNQIIRLTNVRLETEVSRFTEQKS